ncbi:TerB N-terminal domain-containing protein [Aquamicrobium sp. NLF2-7]|uniref:tellurite resistance TerB family protein n=1 Tax=Aquamicrobium sp. NLF2-7 TaxID=2918753 RepID=UPI001EFBCC9F|nr:TerB N-terminal domain-containing protein [Aquamicrobium sp. NLF2-7]
MQSGESVVVGGFSLTDGLFYLGGLLPGQSNGSCGNCVVDPEARVASGGEDREGRTIPYWPSYQSISPVARRTYLSWLAAGRDDPSIGIGYVFLYFYGIERRMFVDQASHDAPVLIAEVRRLLDIYGSNGSFRGYASKFLDAAELVQGPEIYRPPLRADLRNGYEIPLSVRLHLGRKLAAKQPLDGTDALLWLLSLPDTNLRTPATRCFEELAELWASRFTARYPAGLKVNAPKTRLKLDYRAASGGFECRIDMSDGTGPLPDIAAVSAPLDSLRDMLNACTEELAPYSRLLGRNPNAKGTIEATFLLPPELLASPTAMGTALLTKIEQIFGDRKVAGVRVTQLAKALSLDVEPSGKLPSGLCNQIGAFLDRIDIGMEPDRRYGSRNLEADGYVLLFRAPGGAKVDGDAPAYVAAKAMVDVAVLAAAADGNIEAPEYESIKTEIRAMPDLGGIERARLIAYASTLLKDVPGQQGALNKMKKLARPVKEAVVRSATAAILADGHAGPDEVKFLERLYRTLGFPIEGVYATLHRGSVVIDEPVAVAAEQRAPGVRIPPPPIEAGPATGVKIDHARLERLRSETAAVSELLASIFVEEAPASIPEPTVLAPVGERPVRFPGLDAAHAALLDRLQKSEGMDRSELDNFARDLRLLPDGAIERINDWGFDRFDEVLIEEDERVTIPDHLREALREAEAAE